MSGPLQRNWFCVSCFPEDDEDGSNVLPALDLPQSLDAQLPLKDAADTELLEVDKNDETSLLRRVLQGYSDLSRQASPSSEFCSSRYLGILLEAGAEISARLQQEHFEACYRYVISMCRAGALRGIMLLFHQLYDETPLRLRVHSCKGAVASTDAPDVSDTVLAKVFVVECAWSMLCEVPARTEAQEPNYVLLRGQYMPAVRCAESAAAGSIRNVLSTTFQPPDSASQVFPQCLRIAESDRFSANGRAERMVRQDHPRWNGLHLFCAGHQIHSAAQKTILLQLPVARGVSRSLLLFRQPGVLMKFRGLLKKEVLERAKRVTAWEPLSVSALRFREMVTTFFLPDDKRTRRYVIVDQVFSSLLNDDLKALPPRLVNRGNWLAHHHAYQFVGVFCAVHNLLPNLMSKLLQGDDSLTGEELPANPEQALEVVLGDDEVARLRYEQSVNKTVAQEFLSNGALDSMRVLRVALQPQVHLQQRYLHRCSPEWFLSELLNTPKLADEDQKFRVFGLVTGELVELFMQETAELLCSTTLWADLLHTHKH